jgi:hypothetical protein
MAMAVMAMATATATTKSTVTADGSGGNTTMVAKATAMAIAVMVAGFLGVAINVIKVAKANRKIEYRFHCVTNCEDRAQYIPIVDGG